jgi:5-methylcytosine-specific restriction endonuclease McrA
MPRRECLDCNTLTTYGSRCEPCARARNNTTARGLGWTHQRAAATVLADAAVCAMCGLVPTPDDPLTAGHIVSRANGGTNDLSNYQAEHRSCNSAKGAGF